MKRLLLTLCALCATTALWAETWFSPDWVFNLTYSVSSGKATITGGEFYDDGIDLEIPATVDGYSVTAIGDEAFSGCSSLKSVKIPEGVTSIGFQAFYSCWSLTSITIPSSVTSIGMWALDACSSLPVEDGVKYESSKKAVLVSLFSLSDGDFVIPDGVRFIHTGAFSTRSELTSIEIPDSVISIGDGAFYNCTGLTSVEIPDSVTSIGSDAFWGCSYLYSVTFHGTPPSTTPSEWNPIFPEATGYYLSTHAAAWEAVIDADGKWNGLSMQMVEPETPEGEIIWNYTVFNGEASIYSGEWSSAIPQTTSGSITIPSVLGGYPVTSIGDYAFYKCSGLTSVTIPDSVTVIKIGAFRECSRLSSVTIPSSVTSIEWDAFFLCTSLTSITIPKGVTSIGMSTFLGCSLLTSVTIPEGVTSIGEQAFYGCSSLTSITIPSSVTSIGDGAFSDCSRLSKDANGVQYESSAKKVLIGVPYSVTGEFVIPESVRFIHSRAFSNCSSLTSITIPSSVTSIGWSAFSYCESLTSVTIPSSVTSIESHAFSDCSGLTSITIPSSVTSIGSSAFSGCSGLTSVTIPEGVTSIGSSAFSDCTGLTSVTIPSSVTSIERYAFDGCSGLPKDENGVQYESTAKRVLIDVPESLTGKFVIPDSVRFIHSFAFDGCSSLTSVTIPSSVTSIGDGAFEDCSGLTSVTIPSSVTSIGDSAFYECSRLTSVTIPEGVTSIGNSAFSWCSRLTSVEFLGTPPSVGADAFYDVTATGTYLPKHASQWEAVIDADGKWEGLTMQMADAEIPEVEITFDANGGEGGEVVTLESGATLTAPVVTREGYTFIGWSPEVPSTVPAVNTTYTAQWQVNQYTATFNANGGEGGTSVTQDYASALVAPAVTREGYTFIGWSPEVPFTVPAANTTYTAQWKINQYTLYFSSNGGEGDAAVTQDYGTALVAPTVSREGYTFVGWSPEVPAFIPAENVVYIAQWQVNQYTHTFDANGGEGGTSVTQSYASALVAPTVTRVGYTFVGWSPVVPSTVPAENATYTAQWQANQYTVTFDANGGEGGISVTQDYGSTLTAPDVSREGYVFLGWSPEVPATLPASDVTYTAQWQDVSFLTYTITDGIATITGLQAVYPAVLEIPAVIGDAPVVAIAERAFAGCTELTSVSIPTSVTTIGTCAFTACGSPVITVAEANPAYASADGVLFNKEMTTLISAPCVTDSYTLPETVSAIGPSAFENCTGIFTFPAAPIETVGEGAFPATQGTYRYEYATEWKAVITDGKWQNLTMSCANPPSLKVTLTADGGGSVAGAAEYVEGESVTVTATADEGYVFCGWSTTPVVMTPEYTFTMPETDVALTAYFAPKQAVEQYVAGHELITKDDVKEMAFDTPLVEVGADTIRIAISLQTAESLDAWQAMALEGATLEVDQEAGMVVVTVPKGDKKAAFYKFIVPNEQTK